MAACGSQRRKDGSVLPIHLAVSEFEHQGVVMPLDLDAEVRRWGSAGAARA